MNIRFIRNRILSLGLVMMLILSGVSPVNVFASEETSDENSQEEVSVSADQPQTVTPDNPVIPDYASDRGYCGEEIEWAYYAEEELLLISGSGCMDPMAAKENQPWNAYREEICEVQIRETKEGLLPENISDYAFAECTNLQKLIFVTENPDFGVSIGQWAFYRCTSLQSFFRANAAKEDEFWQSEDVSLKNVNKIECAAFSGCEGLTEIQLGSELSVVSRSAFSYCTGLKAIAIPGNIKELGDSTFECCYSLENVVFAEREDELKFNREVFERCTSLETIVLPSNMTEIPLYAFLLCTSLKSVTFPENCKKIGSGAFRGCISLTELSIPYGIEKIDNYAFSGCTGLKEIILPITLLRGSIEEGVFKDCDQVMVYAFRNSGAHRYAILNAIPYTVLTPIKKDYIYTARNGNQYRVLDDDTCALWKYCGDHSNIRIEEEIVFDIREDIEVGAASDLSGTDGVSLSAEDAEVVLASDVTLDGDFLVTFQTSHITRKAFDTYRNTQQELPTYTLKIGNSVLSMEEGTFEDFVYLTDVLSLGAIREISADAFRNCYSLQRVNADQQVDVIGNAAFGGCSALQSIRFNGNETMPACANAFTGVNVSGLTLAGKDGIPLTIPSRKSSTITLASKTASYTGKAISIGKASVIGSSGSIAYYYYTDAACTTKTTTKNGASKTGAAPSYVGKYYVKAKVAQDDQYNAKTSKAAVLTIKPKVTEILSLSAGSGSLSVKWSKRTVQTTGYQMQYSTSSTFSSPTTVTVKSNTTLSKKITGLKRNKKYYVRVRTYRKCGGFNLYSGWCAKKAITTK